MADFKRCGCCGRRYTAETWSRLKLLGNQPAGEENGVHYELELRDCYCASTIAIERIAAIEEAVAQ